MNTVWLFLTLFPAAAICTFILYRRYYQLKIQNEYFIDPKNGIDLLEKVHLNGITQWIRIRAHSRDAPILIYLHGGPGWSELPYSHIFCDDLEKHFLVIQWAQRGAGKSHAWGKYLKNISIDEMINDLEQLVDHLRRQFNKDKIFIIGHSWGSVLGMLAVKKFPVKIHSYIGISQVVRMIENEKLTYKKLMEAARSSENKKALLQVSQIRVPAVTLREMMILHKWIGFFKGDYFDGKGSLKYIKANILSPECSLMDIARFISGLYHSVFALREEFLQIDLMGDIKNVDVPVYFFLGRHDLITPPELAEAFYQNIQAPHKELFWFEHSAHSPHLEESKRFQHLVIEKFKGHQI